MAQVCSVARVFEAQKTVEGAGVRLYRAFGYYEVPLFDPFLLLDDFRANRPEDYLVGFPWHPHRGIETVTYMLEGKVEHGDSIGNAGTIGAGDVQWMTAGSGIIHQEMPEPVNGRMGGFQLWVNLPRTHKMADPRYQEIKSDRIPVISPDPGIMVKVICGSVNGVTGPVRDIVADPEYLDVTVEPGALFRHAIKDGYTAFAYIIGGEGWFDLPSQRALRNRELALFSSGDEILVRSGAGPVRFLFLSGKPIREPVAWRGPIVMNTQEELDTAFDEFRAGTFIRKRSGPFIRID